jgi:hypothetical protein
MYPTSATGPPKPIAPSFRKYVVMSQSEYVACSRSCTQPPKAHVKVVCSRTQLSPLSRPYHPFGVNPDPNPTSDDPGAAPRTT